MRRFGLVTSILMLAACAGQPDGPTAAPAGGHDGAAVSAEPEPVEAAILEQPFTAEQIRDEWVTGFSLVMRRSTPGEVRLERWTVLQADAEGCQIEFAALADDGAVSGEPVVQRSTWLELRDHASFPSPGASRERTTRETALGALEGWLYRVPEEGSEAVSEFFFVPGLPGAPVQMRTIEGGQTVFELEQIERSRPTEP
jgi:hypothetical protein